MLIYSIIILINTAVNNNRQSLILFSRITILALITSLIVLSINLNFNFIDEGIILYGRLDFMIKSHIFVFILFILILSIFIIGSNSFNLRKKLPSIFPYWNKESHTTLPNIKKIEQPNTEGTRVLFLMIIKYGKII